MEEMENNCRCYLCESLCYCDSAKYQECDYRYRKSFGVPENREYELACTRMAVRFARKHGWRFEGWVGHFDPKKHNWYEGAGGHAMIGDMVYSMEDMRTDVMMDAPADAITEYYDECSEEYFYAEKEGREPIRVNYRSWLLGARHDIDRCSEEYLERKTEELEEEKQRLLEEKKKLEEELQAESDGVF